MAIRLGDIEGAHMYTKTAIDVLLALSVLLLSTGCAGLHLGKILKEIDKVKDPCIEITLGYSLTSTANAGGGLSADVAQITDLAAAGAEGVGKVSEKIDMKVTRRVPVGQCKGEE